MPENVAALPMLAVSLMPVVLPAHPLAGLERPASRADLDEHVQLVLSDPVTPDGPSYGINGTKVWRFVELGRRLDFLVAALGWCRMPEHIVAPHLANGRLVSLAIETIPPAQRGR